MENIFPGVEAPVRSSQRQTVQCSGKIQKHQEGHFRQASVKLSYKVHDGNEMILFSKFQSVVL